MNGTDSDTTSERKELHARRTKAPWLSALNNPGDRETAERWLSERGGEPRLRRIADAILKPKRGRGAPEKDYGWLVRRAMEVWMTTPGVDESGAAKIAVAALANGERGSVTADRLRRIAREGLEGATAGDVIEIENDLISRGIALRRDTSWARLADSMQAMMMKPSWMMPPPALAGWADGGRMQTSGVVARATAAMDELGCRIGQVARFAAAFPELFPPDMPARKVAAAYDLVRKALNRDLCQTK